MTRKEMRTALRLSNDGSPDERREKRRSLQVKARSDLERIRQALVASATEFRAIFERWTGEKAPADLLPSVSPVDSARARNFSIAATVALLVECSFAGYLGPRVFVFVPWVSASVGIALALTLSALARAAVGTLYRKENPRESARRTEIYANIAAGVSILAVGLLYTARFQGAPITLVNCLLAVLGVSLPCAAGGYFNLALQVSAQNHVAHMYLALDFEARETSNFLIDLADHPQPPDRDGTAPLAPMPETADVEASSVKNDIRLVATQVIGLFLLCVLISSSPVFSVENNAAPARLLIAPDVSGSLERNAYSSVMYVLTSNLENVVSGLGGKISELSIIPWSKSTDAWALPEATFVLPTMPALARQSQGTQEAATIFRSIKDNVESEGDRVFAAKKHKLEENYLKALQAALVPAKKKLESVSSVHPSDRTCLWDILTRARVELQGTLTVIITDGKSENCGTRRSLSSDKHFGLQPAGAVVVILVPARLDGDSVAARMSDRQKLIQSFDSAIRVIPFFRVTVSQRWWE